MKKLYKELDELNKENIEFLNKYPKSTILQNYFIKQNEALLYANLINNFFENLTKENVREFNLTEGDIGKIKRKYDDIIKEANLAMSNKATKVNGEFYQRFKNQLKKDFPGCIKMINEIEKFVDIKEAKKFLKTKEKEIKNTGKLEQNFNDLVVLRVFEAHIQENNSFPTVDELNKSIETIANNLPNYSQRVMDQLIRSSEDMLDEQRRIKEEFEVRLYQRWKIPIDLLECLVKVSLESGQEHKDKLSKKTDNSNNFKHEAIIKLHARALQISNEILTLLKSGYADGANARWRSLHEIAVITFFLFDNNNEVSKRYLEHAAIKIFKEASDYRDVYKKLGHPPLEEEEFNKIKEEKERLCKKYGKEFKDDYGWIPSSIIRDRNFKSLEKEVRLDKLRPYYHLSSSSVHGGAKGFHRLGIMDGYQDKVFLVGPSNYGLADPLQNTAISLSHVSFCLLALKPDFESIIQIHVISQYVKEIGPEAVNVQKQIEREESQLS